MLQVRYNDRFVEELHLPVEKLDFGLAKPQLEAADTNTSQAWPPVARPLLQQELHHGLPLAVTSASAPKLAQVTSATSFCIVVSRCRRLADRGCPCHALTALSRMYTTR